jgi:hypothetical protein
MGKSSLATYLDPYRVWYHVLPIPTLRFSPQPCASFHTPPYFQPQQPSSLTAHSLLRYSYQYLLRDHQCIHQPARCLDQLPHAARNYTQCRYRQLISLLPSSLLSNSSMAPPNPRANWNYKDINPIIIHKPSTNTLFDTNTHTSSQPFPHHEKEWFLKYNIVAWIRRIKLGLQGRRKEVFGVLCGLAYSSISAWLVSS